jgi:hypothetical protein
MGIWETISRGVMQLCGLSLERLLKLLSSTPSAILWANTYNVPHLLLTSENFGRNHKSTADKSTRFSYEAR